MVANITTAFRKRVEALPWIAAATKAEAQENSTLFMWALISGTLAEVLRV